MRKYLSALNDATTDKAVCFARDAKMFKFYRSCA